MSRTWAVVKREFGESVRSRIFIIGTLFGPLLIVGLFSLQALMFRGGGGEKALAVVDATGAGVGDRVASTLRIVPPGEEEASDRTRFRVEVLPVAARDAEALRSELRGRIAAKQLDGYVWLPANVLADGKASYEGRSATNLGMMVQLRSALQGAVQSLRLSQQGIDPERLASALRPVSLETQKSSGGSASGSGRALFFLGYGLGFVVYLVVIIFGAAVMRGVLEEKKDRIVEVVVSSIRAEQLMLGKVLGIGGASVLQVAVWVLVAALSLRYGGAVMTAMGMPNAQMPRIPGALGVTFLLFFAAGFFLYSGLYAALGALAASDGDMQQLQMPVIFIVLFAYMVMFRAMTDPEGTVARVASWVPLSSTFVMPIRSALAPVSVLEIAGSLATLVAGGLLVTWIGGKIYRVGILATGKRPRMGELIRWLKAA